MHTQMTAAIEKDLGKTPFVTHMTSITPCIWDVEYSLDHVDEVIYDIDNRLFYAHNLFSSSRM